MLLSLSEIVKNLAVKDTGMPGRRESNPHLDAGPPHGPGFRPMGWSCGGVTLLSSLSYGSRRRAAFAQTRRTGGEGLNVDEVIDTPGGGRVPSRGVAFLLLERRAWWSNGERRENRSPAWRAGAGGAIYASSTEGGRGQLRPRLSIAAPTPSRARQSRRAPTGTDPGCRVRSA